MLTSMHLLYNIANPSIRSCMAFSEPSRVE